MIVKADRAKLGAKVGWTSSSHPLPVKFVGSPTIMFQGTALPHKKNKGSLHRGIVQPRREINTARTYHHHVLSLILRLVFRKNLVPNGHRFGHIRPFDAQLHRGIRGCDPNPVLVFYRPLNLHLERTFA